MIRPSARRREQKSHTSTQKGTSSQTQSKSTHGTHKKKGASYRCISTDQRTRKHNLECRDPVSAHVGEGTAEMCTTCFHKSPPPPPTQRWLDVPSTSQLQRCEKRLSYPKKKERTTECTAERVLENHRFAPRTSPVCHAQAMAHARTERAKKGKER